MNFGEPQNLLITPIVDECESILQENESIGKKIENLAKDLPVIEKKLAIVEAKKDNYDNILLEFFKIPPGQKSEKDEKREIEIKGMINTFNQEIDNLNTNRAKILNSINELNDKQESSKQILKLAKSFIFLQKMYENKIKETEENKKKAEKELKIKGKVFFFCNIQK